MDSGLWFHIFELLRMSLPSAAQAAIHKHYQISAAFPLLLRAGGDLSQTQSLKSGLKLSSLAKLMPVCMLAHCSAWRFIPLLVGALLVQVMKPECATTLDCIRRACAMLFVAACVL